VPKDLRAKGEGHARWGIYLGLGQETRSWEFLPLDLNITKVQGSTAAHFFEHWTRLTYEQARMRGPLLLGDLRRHVEQELVEDEAAAERSQASEAALAAELESVAVSSDEDREARRQLKASAVRPTEGSPLPSC
jgi:hypothetical protein